MHDRKGVRRNAGKMMETKLRPNREYTVSGAKVLQQNMSKPICRDKVYDFLYVYH